jgi:protein-tyrosine phosphatase
MRCGSASHEERERSPERGQSRNDSHARERAYDGQKLVSLDSVNRYCKGHSILYSHIHYFAIYRRSLIVLSICLGYPHFCMVDIHCHILPGLDDGADSVEMACAMAEMAIADGITHVIGTPHANQTYPFLPELVKKHRDEIEAIFEGRLIFATGCDFHLSFENLQDIRLEPARYTLNQKDYLLVELADYSIPPSIDQVLHELQLAGLHPVITHPERNPLIRAQPERLFKWLRQGCYAQVTAGSLLGRFGKAAQGAAEEWIRGRAVHFLASDAHNTSSRPLKLKEAFDSVSTKNGGHVARALLVDNPLAAFEGRPLPYVPELAEDLGEQQSTSRRKRFWFF